MLCLLFQKAKPKSTRPPPPFPSSEKTAPATQSQRDDEDFTSPQSPRDRRHVISDSDDADFSDDLLDLDEEELLQSAQRQLNSQNVPNSQEEEVIVVGSDLETDPVSASGSPPSIERVSSHGFRLR